MEQSQAVNGPATMHNDAILQLQKSVLVSDLDTLYRLLTTYRSEQWLEGWLVYCKRSANPAPIVYNNDMRSMERIQKLTTMLGADEKNYAHINSRKSVKIPICANTNESENFES